MQIRYRGRSRTVATSKMERFVIIANGFQPLTIITKRSILDVAAVLNRLWDSNFNESAQLHFTADIYLQGKLTVVWNSNRNETYFTQIHMNGSQELTRNWNGGFVTKVKFQTSLSSPRISCKCALTQFVCGIIITSWSILERKGMPAIFHKKAKKKTKKGKIFENLSKNVENLKKNWKRGGDCVRLWRAINC